MRYFFETTYNGKHFHGWQIQNNANTIQQEIEHCLSTLLNKNTAIVGSGRTDTGVHATAQVFHADIDIDFDNEKFRYKLNSFLPETISVNKIDLVNAKASARFDALERSYEYHMHKEKSPFLTDKSYYFRNELSLELMNEAALVLLEKQNFQSFSKVKTEVNHFNCNISKAYWEEKGGQFIFHITANRFLRGMVRAIVGSLLEVGQQKIDKFQFETMIEAKDRKVAGRAVPAHGLYLTKVVYPLSVFELD